MAQDTTTKYGDREDEVEGRLSEVADEEAQLLDGEDYEQFELDDGSRPVPRQQPQAPRAQSRSIGLWERHRAPRWLAFLYGPDPPKIHTLNPLFPSVQEFPIKWLEKTFPRRWQRAVLLVVFLAAW